MSVKKKLRERINRGEQLSDTPEAGAQHRIESQEMS